MIVVAIDRSESIDAAACKVADRFAETLKTAVEAADDVEVRLAAINAPAQVRQGGPFYLEFVVNSNGEASGYVDLFRGDIRIGDEEPAKVTLRPGENKFRIRQTVTGRPRVLLIDPDVEQTDSLRWAMDEQKIDVEVRLIAGVPTDLAELQGYE